MSKNERYFLTPLSDKIKPRKFAVFDLETTTDLTKVFLAGFSDGKHYRYFESEPLPPEAKGGAVDKLMSWLFSREKYSTKRGATWLYAHNGGDFDFLYLVHWLIENNKRYSFETVPMQSSVLCLQVIDKAYPSRRWTFLDSRRLMNAGLEKIGKAFELGSKVKGEYCNICRKYLCDHFYETLSTNPNRYEYLEQDCKLLYNCIEKFYALIYAAGGDIGITAPSTAMISYRRTNLDAPIPINRHFQNCSDETCDGCLHNFVREGYKGGMVQVLRERFDSDTECSLYDYNSMYAAVMLEPVPCELACSVDGPIDFDGYTQHWQGFIDATVEIPKDTYLPPLPYRFNDKLLFPNGRFRGVWASIELQRLSRIGGRIAEIHKSVWFRGKEIFRSYVTNWYRYRDKSSPTYTKAMDDIAKLMLTSLYGKFGTNEDREKLWFFPTNEDLKNHDLTPIADVILGAYTEEIKLQATYVIPHIAAWITASARCRLWDAMMHAIDAGNRVFYCDTDSIVTDARLPTSTALGELKEVCKIKRGRFVASKMYLLERADETIDVKMKGFSGGFGAGKLTEKDFIKVVDHGEKLEIKRITKLNEGLRDLSQFPRMKVEKKGINGSDDKRCHLSDGNTRPWVINNGNIE